MRNIILLCNAGLSTSMLVTKIQEAAKAKAYELQIAAYPASDAATVAKDADMVLLGPQIMYMEKQIKKEVSCPVAVIDRRQYGMVDGKGVLAFIQKQLHDA